MAEGTTLTPISRMTTITYDTKANFPVSPPLYHLAFATDENILYYWNGAAYIALAGKTITSLSDVKIILKTADETVNNSTVLQNDDELLFAIGANEVWSFDLLIDSISTNAVPLGKATIVLPVGATMFAQGYSLQVGTWLINGWIEGQTWNFDISIAARPTFRVRGVVINGANAGNFQFQWAQQVATVADTKVLANSFIIAVKLG